MRPGATNCALGCSAGDRFRRIVNLNSMRALPIQARSRRARQSARRNAPLFRGFPALAARTVLVILLAIAQAPAASAQLPSLEAPPLPLPPALRLPLEQIKLPTPFSISLYVDTVVPNARFMALGKADGNATVVFVSSIDGNVSIVPTGAGAVWFGQVESVADKTKSCSCCSPALQLAHT